MGQRKSTGSFPLLLATVTTVTVGVTVTTLVVGWVGRTAFKVESLGDCQWVKTVISKVQEEKDQTWALTEETLVQLLETGNEKGNVMEGGTVHHQTKTSLENMVPME